MTPGLLLSGGGWWSLLFVILDYHLVGAGDHVTATEEGYVVIWDQFALLNWPKRNAQMQSCVPAGSRTNPKAQEDKTCFMASQRCQEQFWMADLAVHVCTCTSMYTCTHASVTVRSVLVFASLCLGMCACLQETSGMNAAFGNECCRLVFVRRSKITCWRIIVIF